MKCVKDILPHLSAIGVQGDPDRGFDDVQYDSRLLTKNAAFVAVRGMQTDGHRFIRAAFEKGVRVFFTEEALELPDSTVVVLPDTRVAMAPIAQAFFDFPEKKLRIIGITGTNGKTTTAYLLQSILNNSGMKCGLLSTIQSDDGGVQRPAERTTPEALDIYRTFRQMVKNDCRAVAMEVSSHALSLQRVSGIPFSVRIFTNLGRDHLDFHKTEKQYFAAKKELFKSMSPGQTAVLNLDDEKYYDLFNELKVGDLLTYSMQHPQANVKYVSHSYHAGRMNLKITANDRPIEMDTALFGKFNIYNIMAATAAAMAMDIPVSAIGNSISTMKMVPGRSEVFPAPENIQVVVDYAHTPDGLEKVLLGLSEIKGKSITVVFGAGGNRDHGKRPEMGRVAEKYADKIILTNDNPRNENPMDIIRAIRLGMSAACKVQITEDREAAIVSALKNAGNGEIILIAGKGHETYQEIDGKRVTFDDREIIRKYFKNKNWPVK